MGEVSGDEMMEMMAEGPRSHTQQVIAPAGGLKKVQPGRRVKGDSDYTLHSFLLTRLFMISMQNC